MSGNLTVPTDFALVVTNQPGSELGGTTGGNFGAICSYINVREITFGVIADRPAAGVPGRYYFATDQGIFSADNGATWVPLAPAVSAASQGTYKVLGLRGAPNAATPLTKYDVLSADLVQLRNPTTGGLVIRTALAGPITNDITLAGPAANGRDQAGAFAASSWTHLYLIWNNSTVATLSSAVAPPTGPTLPATYTHWAYVGPVRLTGATQFVPTRIDDAYASIVPVVARALAAGTGAEQTYDVSATVPPNHVGANVRLFNSAGNVQSDIRFSAGGDVAMNAALVGAGSPFNTATTSRLLMPAQTIFFIGNAGGAHEIQVLGYWIPNG